MATLVGTLGANRNVAESIGIRMSFRIQIARFTLCDYSKRSFSTDEKFSGIETSGRLARPPAGLDHFARWKDDRLIPT